MTISNGGLVPKRSEMGAEIERLTAKCDELRRQVEDRDRHIERLLEQRDWYESRLKLEASRSVVFRDGLANIRSIAHNGGFTYFERTAESWLKKGDKI